MPRGFGGAQPTLARSPHSNGIGVRIASDTGPDPARLGRRPWVNVRFPVDVPSASRPRRRAWKLVVLAPAGAAALLLIAEFAARELHLGAPSYSNWGLPEERWGLVVPDRDLFW